MRHIIDFFLEFFFALVTAIGFGVFFWHYKPDQTVSMAFFSCVTFPLALSLIFLLKYIVMLSRENNELSLPKLKAIKDGKYIFEPSIIFPSQSFVSLYYVDDYEELIGVGYVEAVMTDKRNLQVVVPHFHEGKDANFVHQNRTKVVLKPTIPYSNWLNFMSIRPVSQGDGQ